MNNKEMLDQWNFASGGPGNQHNHNYYFTQTLLQFSTIPCHVKLNGHIYACCETDRRQNRLCSKGITRVLMNTSGHGVRRINSKPTSIPPSLDGATGNTSIADHWASLFDSVFNIRTLEIIYVFIYHKQPFWRIWVTLIVITPDASIA